MDLITIFLLFFVISYVVFQKYKTNKHRSLRLNLNLMTLNKFKKITKFQIFFYFILTIIFVIMFFFFSSDDGKCILSLHK
jgi:hypothetical protein